jgi:hypothetical protein
VRKTSYDRSKSCFGLFEGRFRDAPLIRVPLAATNAFTLHYEYPREQPSPAPT